MGIRESQEDSAMKYYFLALGTFLVVCVGCHVDGRSFGDSGDYHAPPAHAMQRPGPMVDGPGPGVLPMMQQAAAARAFSTRRTQIRFIRPVGMKIGWKTGQTYAENQRVTPTTYDFVQGATYRLKLTEVAGRDGMTLYPTMQVYPAHATSDAYLAHNSVPLELTDEDLDQVESNNFVTKVIYLPDPQHQELAVAGVEMLVSTRLDPGVDPVSEADRRGTIMVVLRVGNMDMQTATTGPAPNDGAAMLGPGGIRPVSFNTAVTADGAKGQFVPPTPISVMDQGMPGIPGPMLMGQPAGPGQPGMNPIAGVGGTPQWGMPWSPTPIGLPGPAHLPLGGPAGLRSYTVKNNTPVERHDPVRDFRVVVKHNPGIRMPKPVSEVRYTEKHPTFAPGTLSRPAWANPNGQ